MVRLAPFSRAIPLGSWKVAPARPPFTTWQSTISIDGSCFRWWPRYRPRRRRTSMACCHTPRSRQQAKVHQIVFQSPNSLGR